MFSRAKAAFICDGLLLQHMTCRKTKKSSPVPNSPLTTLVRLGRCSAFCSINSSKRSRNQSTASSTLRFDGFLDFKKPWSPVSKWSCSRDGGKTSNSFGGRCASWSLPSASPYNLRQMIRKSDRVRSRLRTENALRLIGRRGVSLAVVDQ